MNEINLYIQCNFQNIFVIVNLEIHKYLKCMNLFSFTIDKMVQLQ